MRKIVLVALIIIGVCSIATSGAGQEKLKFATPIRALPTYYLPMLAAEEKGMWKDNGMAGEWAPFSSTGLMMRAVAGGHIQMGGNVATGLFPVIARGLAITIVADLSPSDDFFVWVKSDSRIKEPLGLKGAKIGVASFGGTQHVYGQVIVNALGLGKEVKFVSVGGTSEAMALLRTGGIDGVMLTLANLIGPKMAGEVRPLAAASQYRPRPWIGFVIYARKDFIASNAESVRKTIRTVFQAVNWVRENKAWSLAKMKAESGYSEEAAREIFDTLNFTRDGKIDPKAIDNVRNFAIDNRLVPKDKVPPTAELYTDQFVR